MPKKPDRQPHKSPMSSIGSGFLVRGCLNVGILIIQFNPFGFSVCGY